MGDPGHIGARSAMIRARDISPVPRHSMQMFSMTPSFLAGNFPLDPCPRLAFHKGRYETPTDLTASITVALLSSRR